MRFGASQLKAEVERLSLFSPDTAADLPIWAFAGDSSHFGPRSREKCAQTISQRRAGRCTRQHVGNAVRAVGESDRRGEWDLKNTLG